MFFYRLMLTFTGYVAVISIPLPEGVLYNILTLTANDCGQLNIKNIGITR
jgi:hypothetical protein